MPPRATMSGRKSARRKNSTTRSPASRPTTGTDTTTGSTSCTSSSSSDDSSFRLAAGSTATDALATTALYEPGVLNVVRAIVDPSESLWPPVGKLVCSVCFYLTLTLGLAFLNWASLYYYQQACHATLWQSLVAGSSPVCKLLHEFHVQGQSMFSYLVVLCCGMLVAQLTKLRV
jgi:hypothetical protein